MSRSESERMTGKHPAAGSENSAKVVAAAPSADQLEAALSSIRHRSRILPEQAFSGEWNLVVPDGNPVLYLISEGAGWLAAAGEAPRRFAAGDVLLLIRGVEHRLDSDPGDERLPNSAADWPLADPFGAVRVVTVRIEFTDAIQSPLLASFPAVMQLSRDGGSALLERLAACVIAEAREVTPALPLVQSHLGSALLLETLVRATASQAKETTGWVAALADREIGPILRLMLQSPATDWTVARLAEQGAMSRSTFARRFQALLGCGPMDCLVDIRMRRACQLLAQRTADLKSISRTVGYRSAAAFSASFKRWSGQSPSDYRREQR